MPSSSMDKMPGSVRVPAEALGPVAALHGLHLVVERDLAARHDAFRIHHELAIDLLDGPALLDGRRELHGSRFLGVPVRHAARLVPEVVAVPVLDRDLDFTGEPDRVLEVKVITGLKAAGVVLVDGRAVVHERVRLHAPRLVEAVLGARAMEVRRPLVAVDPDHVVALAPPRRREEIRD